MSSNNDDDDNYWDSDLKLSVLAAPNVTGAGCWSGLQIEEAFV